MPVLYLLEQGSTLRKDGEVFAITKEGKVLEKIPAIKVEQVVILGNVNLTTPVIHYLLEQGIDLCFCSSYGKFHGHLISTESNFGLLRQRQTETILQSENKLAIAKAIVYGKLSNQHTLLRRYRHDLGLPQICKSVTELEEATHKIENCATLASLRGIEGSASASYYRAFREILKQDMGFATRIRRPPTDPVNSLLSFGYTFLTYNVQAAIYTVGLDPFLGFLHTTEYSRPSLALDLTEEFRSIIVDSLVLWLINTRVMTEDDFQRPEKKGAMVVLTDEGVKKFIHHYEQRIQSHIYHQRARGQVTYRRCFELQARGLAQVILGRESSYRPFLVR